MLSVCVLQSHESAVLSNIAADVFDRDVDPGCTAQFFADPRHHIAVALDTGRVVGMASGVHYVHPGKS